MQFHAPEPVATRIIAIRHGETAWNVDTRIQGQLDIGLNGHGRWQAEQAALALAHEAIDAVYTSDLLRAWATAQALCERQHPKPPLHTVEGLRERALRRIASSLSRSGSSSTSSRLPLYTRRGGVAELFSKVSMLI